MPSEVQLWTRMRTALQGYGHWCRVENITEAGTPDVNYCLKDGAEGWLELKNLAVLPTRETTAVFKNCGLRPEQLEWITYRVKLGGRVHIMARGEDTMWLIHGHHALNFNKATVNELNGMSAWHHTGPMLGYDWESFINALVCRRPAAP